jgi:hypothetical protein
VERSNVVVPLAFGSTLSNVDHTCGVKRADPMAARRAVVQTMPFAS